MHSQARRNRFPPARHWTTACYRWLKVRSKQPATFDLLPRRNTARADDSRAWSDRSADERFAAGTGFDLGRSRLDELPSLAQFRKACDDAAKILRRLRPRVGAQAGQDQRIVGLIEPLRHRPAAGRL